MVTNNEVKQQSINAYMQWKVQWRKHAKEHSAYEMKSFNSLMNVGVGKAILMVGNGYSLEKEIETIKENQGNVDIMACDKSLGHLLNHGITPQYVMVCDANVSYEKYLKPYVDQIQDTILIMNVCANPEWSAENWADKYFFVNMDAIQSEQEFLQLSGCPNKLAAATNVSGQMVVAATQCDGRNRQNFFGYDKILLIGFDYCWPWNGHYYAFDPTGGGKHNYMRHSVFAKGLNEYVYTSGNLHFSAKWLSDYVRGYNLPVVNCCDWSLLQTPYRGKLAEQMQYKGPNYKNHAIELCDKREWLLNELKKVDKTLKKMAINQYQSMKATV